jgi:superfamily I DNA/RNA helicase
MSSTDGDPATSSSSTDHRSPITDHDKVTLSSIHQAKGLEWQAALIRSPRKARSPLRGTSLRSCPKRLQAFSVFLIWLVDG